MSYPNYVFSLFAFIGFLLVSIPLPWHLEGTVAYYTNSPIVAQQLSLSMEHGHMSLHDLDRSSLPQPVYQLHNMERECDQLGPGVVRYLYVLFLSMLDVIAKINFLKQLVL